MSKVQVLLASQEMLQGLPSILSSTPCTSAAGAHAGGSSARLFDGASSHAPLAPGLHAATQGRTRRRQACLPGQAVSQLQWVLPQATVPLPTRKLHWVDLQVMGLSCLLASAKCTWQAASAAAVAWLPPAGARGSGRRG